MQQDTKIHDPCTMRTQKRLTAHEREQILLGSSLSQSQADLARLLGRHRSVISREISRHWGAKMEMLRQLLRVDSFHLDS